jgi:CheY-like chemotaxis protein
MRGAPAERSKGVFIVDDDRDVRETLADAVESMGRLVFTAADGTEALRRLEAGDIPQPCLIVLDWKMWPMVASSSLSGWSSVPTRPDSRCS